MLNFEKLKMRGLLTETLPYEVPAIFSNEFLFASELSLESLAENHRKLIAESDYRRPLKTEKYTIPMNFPVRKGVASKNTLSVIHPLQQMNIANFLDDYAATIVEECKASPASLRAPAEVVPFLSDTASARFFQKQDEFAQSAPKKGLLGIPYAPSYFSLKKYNLLDRFYSSNELLRLETRFPLLRTIDVTKCFFNIYTHSMSWAVKDKKFSKQHAPRYSFEGRFDELMQKANYNETNGIPVGPEISRIFAEIIFQRIDQNILDMMSDRFKLQAETDYTFRRYVDDFFLFARDQETLDRLTLSVHDCLEEFKLFPNHGKQHDFQRPFITNITLAKKGITDAASTLEKLCSLPLCENPENAGNVTEEKTRGDELRHRAKEFGDALQSLRIIIGRTESNFSEVSGPVYTAITHAIDELTKAVSGDAKAFSADISVRLRGILRILFYCVASDFRVPPLFKCHQVIEKARRISSKTGEVNADVIDALIIFELTQLFTTNSNDDDIDKLPVELCNLFVIAAIVNSDLFLQQAPVREFIMRALNKKEFSYFSFVGVLFLIRHTTLGYDGVKDHIISRVSSVITAKKAELRVDAEVYLLFSDFVSCPYIATNVRVNVLNEVIGNGNLQANEADLRVIAPHFAFIDWTGSKAAYILHRKRLQPVYFSW